MQLKVEEFGRPCPCGEAHRIDVRDIILEKGALEALPGLLQGPGYREYRQLALISDENTWAAAGERVFSLLEGAGYTPASVCLSPRGLHADEHAVEKAGAQLPAATQMLLAVGSGTVHDITRYLAHQRGIPFVSVPTAASVDGFVSTVAAMTWHGFKKSFIASSPLCVVADSSVFSRAPQRLTASGVSDLLGKYTAIADWRIAHLVTGEHICERVCAMELEAIGKVRGSLAAISAGGEEACEQLMYGLLLSGLAMQMVGNSRPASGAEHHLSHIWEMGVISPHTEAYHGEKVGVGLHIAAGVYGRARERLLAGQYRLVPHAGLELELLQAAFPQEAMYREMLEENTPDPLSTIDEAHLAACCPEIAAILAGVPAAQEIDGMLAAAGAPRTLCDIGLPADLAQKSIRLSPYVRKRLTFMRLIKLFDFYGELCAQ